MNAVQYVHLQAYSRCESKGCIPTCIIKQGSFPKCIKSSDTTCQKLEASVESGMHAAVSTTDVRFGNGI